MKNQKTNQTFWQKFFKITSIAVLFLMLFFSNNLTFAEDANPPAVQTQFIASPTENQPAGTDNVQTRLITSPVEITLNETTDTTDITKNWSENSAQTFGLKFLIRGKEALGWSLDINSDGFDNPAIQTSYEKVLTIVNSLFILGLLGIAGMWMFSLLIPRSRLKKVSLIFALTVMLVNFALPANRLLIDGTNLLQKTLLTNEDKKIQIIDIINTPTYSDAIVETPTNTFPEDEKIEIGTVETMRDVVSDDDANDNDDVEMLHATSPDDDANDDKNKNSEVIVNI